MIQSHNNEENPPPSLSQKKNKNYGASQSSSVIGKILYKKTKYEETHEIKSQKMAIQVSIIRDILRYKKVHDIIFFYNIWIVQFIHPLTTFYLPSNACRKTFGTTTKTWF